MKAKTVNLIQLNAAVMLWGLTAMFAKGIDLPTQHKIFYRSVISAVALLIFLLATKSPFKVQKPKHYWIMTIFGILMCTHWLTYFRALEISSAAVAILALHTYPVITAVIEPFIFGEKLKFRDILMAIIVFAGVLIMSPTLDLSNKTTQGIVLGVISGLLFMTRNLMTRKYVQSYSGSAMMLWQVIVSAIILLPVIIFGDSVTYTSKNINLLLLLGVIFTALPQALFAASFKNLSARTVGILATLLPFYGAFWGYFIHKEQISSRTAIGGSIILACIIYETVIAIKPVKETKKLSLEDQD